MASIILKTICLSDYNRHLACLLVLIALTLYSCQNEAEPPFSIIPEISLVDISHDTIVEYTETLVLTIEYKDGDGDIGFEDPDQNAIFVRDARLEDYDGFYIGPVAPIGSNVPIQGKVDIEFPSIFLFGNRDSETTRFYIRLIDRAGHESNTIETPAVVIKRNN